MKELENWEEKFANAIHEQWLHWQKYLHTKCSEHENGKGEFVCFPSTLFTRWERQINTPYSELSEEEKQSDREVYKEFYKEIVNSIIAEKDKQIQLAVKEERERIVEFLRNEIENWGDNDYSYKSACEQTIEYITKVEE